jgi:single-strand DNA-binding protein
MAGSVNKAILIGFLGKDPDVRNTQSGGKIVNLSVATSESWTDKASGERKEKTEWHRVSIFNERVGDFTDKYARKGSKVYVEGQLQTRKWTDQSGVEKYTTEVVIGPFNGNLVLLSDGQGGGQREGGGTRGGSSQQRSGGTQQSGGGQQSWDAPKGGDDLDDSIPF